MKSTIKRVAVLGAGNGGFATAADLALRGFDVVLHGRRNEQIQPVIDNDGIEVSGVLTGKARLAGATSDLAEAVRGADLIIVVLPSIAHKACAEALAPWIGHDSVLLLNPGHTGGGLHFRELLRRAGGAMPRLCEVVTLAYVSRKEGPAHIGIYKQVDRLGFAALPATETEDLAHIIRPVFPAINPATSVLETGFGNVNAVFHPPGMLMNAGWIEHTGGDFRFYIDGLTPSVARTIELLDTERMAVAAALGIPARSFLQLFHEAGLTDDVGLASNSVYTACQRSDANRTIMAPSSLADRYIDEDVGSGLVPIASLARLVNVQTPVIDAMIAIASATRGIDFLRSGTGLADLGIAEMTPTDLLALVTSGDIR